MEIDPVIACGIVGNIGQFWLKEQFTDLQINIDDHQFHCYRFILCACSELFQVLLQSEVKGEVEHPVREVTVRGVSPEIFEFILKAIYKGENGLDTENMIAFWHAVHELQIPVLVSKCEAFVSSHITRENCFRIYTSALLLESDKVIKMVHEFMAENFEYFSKCQLFLLLSSKTICEILGSRNLKVATQNVLVESILKWVSHEPCGNNAETLCAGDGTEVQSTNNVSGQRFDHSADVVNDKKGSVEVILQQPSPTGLNSCLQARCPTETTAARKESLGKLLKLVQLSEASKDCLELLADMDMVMGIKETRDIVKQALEAHSKAQESVKAKVISAVSIVASAKHLEKEHVVVFRNRDQIYAYSLNRNKLFNFMVGPDDLLSIYTFNNCIFMTSETSLTVAVFPFSHRDSPIFPSIDKIHCSVIVDDFFYLFADNGLYRWRCNDKNYDWFRLIDFNGQTDFVLVNIFKGNIIFCCKIGDGSHMYSFNIETKRCWRIMTSIYSKNIVSFILRDQLYVLNGNGYFWNMTPSVASPTKPVNSNVLDCAQRVWDCAQTVWDDLYQLFGAVVYSDNLLIFANLNFLTTASTYKSKIPGVSTINLVHLNSATQCYPLAVPQKMLFSEV